MLDGHRRPLAVDRRRRRAVTKGRVAARDDRVRIEDLRGSARVLRQVDDLENVTGDRVDEHAPGAAWVLREHADVPREVVAPRLWNEAAFNSIDPASGRRSHHALPR